MKKDLFEMGAKFEDDWVSDNKQKVRTRSTVVGIKTPEKHQLHLAKEKRRGKVVTIVKPFHLSKEDLQSLLKSLKKKLGTGGTVKEDTLEFQGDIPETLRSQLEALHYRFKK